MDFSEFDSDATLQSGGGLDLASIRVHDYATELELGENRPPIGKITFAR